MKQSHRNSSIELMRIVMMFLIVAHHYVVNSGLFVNDVIAGGGVLLFGGWGKVAINCFILTTGYYMYDRAISVKKFIKLLSEIIFYNLVINFIFIFAGRQSFSIDQFISWVFPINGLSHDFRSAYLVLYLLIPLLNGAIANIDKRTHIKLIVFLTLIYSIFQWCPIFAFDINYVEWFCIVYFIGAYMKKYPSWVTEDRRITLSAAPIALMVNCLAVLFMLRLCNQFSQSQNYIKWGLFLLADANKISVLLISILIFFFFKNLPLSYHPIINRVATTMFGVLLIHSNSHVMRNWLWNDICKNHYWYTAGYFTVHAIICVTIVFVSCVIIDFFRQYLVEKPLFEKSHH